MIVPSNAPNEVIDTLLEAKAKMATMYVSAKQIVRATRRHSNVKNSNIELSVTIGRPNFAERKFIKAAKKAGEPFPIKKIQLKFPGKSKK